MDELPVVRAGSEASGPARLQHTVATEVAQGAVPWTVVKCVICTPHPPRQRGNERE